MKYTESSFINDLISCIRADEAVSRDQKAHPNEWDNLSYAAMRKRRCAIAARTNARIFTPAGSH